MSLGQYLKMAPRRNPVVFIMLLLLYSLIIRTGRAQESSKNNNEVASDNKRIVCYYTNWSIYRSSPNKLSPGNIDAHLCTHLIYAFGTLDLTENGLKPSDSYADIDLGGYAAITGLKVKNENLKTMLSIGGTLEGSSNFSILTSTKRARMTFVENTVRFLRTHNFDGLDVDWQHPTFKEGSHTDDKQNYVYLLQELRATFDAESLESGKQRMLLSMTVPSKIDFSSGYDLSNLNKQLDFISIVCYDYHTDRDGYTSHHAPLKSIEEISKMPIDAKLNVNYSVEYYVKNGINRNKLNIGIPTYGRSYVLASANLTEIGAATQMSSSQEPGFLPYYQLCSNLKEHNPDMDWIVIHKNPDAVGPYAYNHNLQWVSYDDEQSVKVKGNYARQTGLGGIMYWTIDDDDFNGNCHSRPYPLIQAGKDAFLGTAFAFR